MQHFRNLIEALPGSVVTGAPQHNIVPPSRTIVQIGVTTRDNESDIGRGYRGIFKIYRTDVPFEVVYGYEWFAQAIG